MNTILAVIAYTLFATVSIMCGSALWLKRRDTGERSRTHLALFGMMMGGVTALRLIYFITSTALPSFKELI